MTQIIDHGRWHRYQPATPPPYTPPGALFIRRESDSVDWYDYVKDPKNFGADTVKFTAFWEDLRGSYVVGAATRDVTLLFPAGMLVRELTEFHGTDPQTELGVKRYDPDSNTLHDLPPLKWSDPLQDVLDRLAVIETRLGIRP